MKEAGTMKNNYRTKEQIMKECDEMCQKVLEIEKCKEDFRKVQEKYDKLLHSAPDALVFLNAEGRIVMVNAQFDKMFGFSNGEAVGKGLDTLIPERFRSGHVKYVADFFSHPRVHPMGSDFEIYALKKNGEEFPVDITLSPLNTDEGLLITAAIRDITKRKQAEEQVELNFQLQRVVNSMLQISLESLSLETQFEKILDLILSVPYLSLKSKGVIYIVDEDRPGILVMKAQKGFTEGQDVPCVSVPFGRCLCGQAALHSRIIYSDHLNNRHEIHGEGVFPHGHYCVPILSGREVLGLINVFVKEGHKRSKTEEGFLTSVASTLASIIKHDKTDRERKRLQDELAEAEKLAALGRFTANVAHEIRNPLTALGGFARRLNRNIPKGTKDKEYANFIIDEVTRLEGILKNVLTFSRDITLQFEEHPVHEIIDRVLKINEELFRERSITVRTTYNDMTPVLIDAQHVHEALENIVLNAIDSMQEGGILSITTDKKRIEGMPFQYVAITDTGAGIPQDKMDIIFEPFYTTKVAQKGTGLGLSITKKVLEEHGGLIRVESEVGKGSTFTLYFPYRLNMDQPAEK
jgi:PAS domain S-box-containing protein